MKSVLRAASTLFFLLPVGLGYAQDYASVKTLIVSGKEDDAISMLNTVEDKNSIEYLNLLGEAQMRKGLYEEALINFAKAEFLQEQDQNHDELQLAETYSFIAVLHYTMGNNQLSLQYHFKALELRVMNSNMAATAASTNDIGLVYSRSNPEKALEFYKNALEDYLELYGRSDERTVTAYINIGLAYRNLILYDDALDNLEKALAIRQLLGRGYVQEAFIHTSIGTVYSARKEHERALVQFDLALEIYTKNYGKKHPEIGSIHNLIGNVEQAQGNLKEALNNYQKALRANVADFDSGDLYNNPKLENYYNADVLLSSLFQKAKAFENLHNSFSLKIKDLTMAYTTIGQCDNLIDKIRQFRSSESDKVVLGSLAEEVYESAIRISLNMAAISWGKAVYREKAFYFSDKSKSAVLLAAIADANAKSFSGIPDDLLEQERLFKAQVTYYKQKISG